MVKRQTEWQKIKDLEKEDKKLYSGDEGMMVYYVML